MKEIFLLILEIFKALTEILWEKIKYVLKILWIRFFGYEEIPQEKKEAVVEWGVTGEDEWPGITETETKEPPVKEMVVSPPSAIPDLPDSYGENRIVIMQRDPLCLFCYWELQQAKIDNFLKNLSTLAYDASLVLRVYDVTNILFDGNNANKYFDSVLVQGAKDWYIHLEEPNRSFCADIGFLTSDGTFHMLTRSNTITTPGMCPSDITEDQRVEIEAPYEKVYASMGIDAASHVPESASAKWQRFFSHILSSSETC